MESPPPPPPQQQQQQQEPQTPSKDKNTTSTTPTATESKSFKGDLPLWKRMFTCAGMLALESYITFEEIYLTTTLQRLHVPYSLLSLPGAVSGACGSFVVPLLGWAIDRYSGNKRPFATGTLTLLSVGMAILIYVGSASLYHHDPTVLQPDPIMAPATNHSLSNGSASDVITGSGNAASTGNLSLALTNNGGNDNDNNDNNNNSDTRSRELYVMGIVAIVGFTLGDHGYDTSALTVRSYILSISPASQHDSLLLTTTTMGAIGGCVTSLIGYLDLSSLFPRVEGQVLDEGDAQFLVQSVIFVVFLLVCFPCTLLIDSKFFENRSDSPLAPSPPKHDRSDYKPLGEEELFSIDGEASESKRLVKGRQPFSDGYQSQGSSPTFAAMVETNNRKNAGLEPGDLSSRKDKRHNPSGGDTNPGRTGQKTQQLQHSCSEKPSTGCITLNRRTRSKIALMVMVFWVIIAMSSFFFYITNYVAEVIYKGDPHAHAGSDEYTRYVTGTRMASLSMLVFYVAFVFYNLFHERILNKIGMRWEFIVTSVLVTVFTLALVLTENLVILFVTMVPLAAYRSCSFTVPFILANKYSQEEHKETSSAESHVSSDTDCSNDSGNSTSGSKSNRRDCHDGDSQPGSLGSAAARAGGSSDRSDGVGGEAGDSPPSGSGSALASVTVMIPLTYCLVSVLAGPLISVTGNTALPIYVSICAYGLGTLCGAFVDFGQ